MKNGVWYNEIQTASLETLLRSHKQLRASYLDQLLKQKVREEKA